MASLPEVEMFHPELTGILGEERVAELRAMTGRRSGDARAGGPTPRPWRRAIERLFTQLSTSRHPDVPLARLRAADIPGASGVVRPRSPDPADNALPPRPRPRLSVLAIPGSTRRDSFNRQLLEAARSAVSPSVEILIFEGLKAIPPFDEDDEAEPPTQVVDLRQKIAISDAVLIATPEYNSSLPGQLKNVLDWVSRPHRASVLQDKPAAVIGASPSPFGAVRAQAAVRQVLSASGAGVIEGGLAVSRAYEAFDPDGQLRDTVQAQQLRDTVRALAKAASVSLEPQAA
jgi:chromate reductase